MIDHKIMNKIIYLFLIATIFLACKSTISSSDDISFNEPDASYVDYDAGKIDANSLDSGTDSTTDSSVDGSVTSHCGSNGVVKCRLGESCRSSNDCDSQACDYHGKCIAEKSCTVHFGGDTCGQYEIGDPKAKHESCCKSLPVTNYTDPTHQGKTLYLDKYEITAGRMRAFVATVSQEMGGVPNFKRWVTNHRPTNWNDNWNKFLPSDYEGDQITINKLLLGDPRHFGQTPAEAGPGVILPPDTDQSVSTGLNHQFNGQIFTDLHGTNCGTYASSYGLPTYYYPSDVLIKFGEVPRSNPIGYNGEVLKAQDVLDSKSMNCATNLMFQLLCSFDGGEVMSNEIFDFITASPSDRPINVSGCGIQFSDHGDLLSNILTSSVFFGGRCANAYDGGVNLFFDAGQELPVAGSPLNTNFYHYPDLGVSNNDKSWAIAAPGRMYLDVVRIKNNDEGWMDLAGNLNETVIETYNGVFTGKFAVRGQGIGFGSERSDLNVSQMPLMVGPLSNIVDTVDQGILRVQRPEVKSGLVGARCMRFK